MSFLKKIFRTRLRFYVSPMDKLYEQWDETHKKTKTQLAEIKKYEKIYYLRDNPKPEEVR